MPEIGYRKIKAELQSFFERLKRKDGFSEELLDDRDNSVIRLLHANPAASLSPLSSFLVSTDPAVKWVAVTLIGQLVSQHASSDMDWARTTIRRFMWYLNDESGGIGWGIPEAMGEILRNHHGLALEYGKILWSYVDPEGNHLENEELLEGALWGIARIATRWEDVYSGFSYETVFNYSNSLRPVSRLCAGIILKCFEKMGRMEVSEKLFLLESDSSRALLFWDGKFFNDSIKNILAGVNQWILWTKNRNTS